MKKGFTLIEILTVIIILAILFVIAVPQISKIINNSKTSIYKRNEEVLIKASELYTLRNQEYYPASIGDTTEITLEELQEVKYISNIINPENKNEECNGYVLVTKTKEDEYEYVPHIKCGLEINSSSEDNLVAHYKLNGNAFDYTLNNNEGIIFGNPVFTERKEKEDAISFLNSGDYVEFNHIPEIDTQTYTYLMWINHNTDPTGSWNRPFLNKAPRQPGMWFFTDDNKIHFSTNHVNSSNYSANSISSLDKNEWHFVAVQSDWNGTQTVLKFFLNGELETTTTIAVEPTISTSLLYIGKLELKVSDLKIYSRALSEDEIILLYELEK